jgi:PAS domain S-box-containing protein
MPPTTISPLTEPAFERMPLPGIVLDPKSRVVHANAAARAVLGVGDGDILGREITDVIQSDDATWCSTDPVDQLGTPAIDRELNARIGGKRRVLRVAVYPIAEGEEGRLIVLHDAAAEVGDNEAVQEYKTTLEELCACVAHEIRNPLTGIRTTVQFVASKLEAEDPRGADLVEVLKEMDRIEEIIGDLLRFGRPAEFTKEKTSLNALIVRVLDSMEAQLREAEIETQRNFSDELPEFSFSPDSLQQVLLNLVRNAMEAMPEGGRLKVTTTLRRFRSERPPEVEIFLSDSGHGIPEDLLEDIFNPFFTTRHNGTGLGLPISLGIVRAHGGRMTARNRADGGVTFRVSLPLVSEEGPTS